MREFFNTIQTPQELKEKIEYDSDHYVLSDGWLYQTVINN